MAFLVCFVASRFAALAEKAPRNDGSEIAAILVSHTVVIASEAKQSRVNQAKGTTL